MGRRIEIVARASRLVLSCGLNSRATLEPPPQMQQLLGAVHGNQEAMDGFCRVNAGVTSPIEFFAEANLGRIFAAAAAR